ncbi:hypothetical protein PSTG_04776 [Puccinia striiformis f. sp. tritici PST-78]|uniref:Uncharacterized protein n=1 Tax=Puccinia striiformis f. sp. tritici PST-78 TaxID=1165861 RepID=A0A0L0VRV8_9BASI|nr:hypothetical protein PSTG_04776 [Puccinia striiformis f. sp. tritici PST-78]
MGADSAQLDLRQSWDGPITPMEQVHLVGQVVDFSKAQTEGFISAYIKVFWQGTREEVRALLRGCREHYQQSVGRIKQNRVVILLDEEALFAKCCMELMDQCDPKEKSYKEKVNFIRQQLGPLVEDTPDGPSALPETTNAQESMHCLYYMISEGKQCVMVGFVKLFTFVKSHKEDWNTVIKGVAISYGTQKQKDVGLSMGQAPKRKRQNAPVNNGRPPNTTNELVEGHNKRSAKLGLPVGSTNIDKNRFTTYPLYHALQDNLAQKNRCWMAVGLESLYALFSPLWLCGISGAGKDLFTVIANQFNSRTTYELTLIGTIRLVLTCVQGKIHALANNQYPSCSSDKPSAKPKKTKRQVEKINLEVELVLDPILLQQSAHLLLEHSRVDFMNPSPPLHLNIHLDCPGKSDWWLAKEFQSKTNCPLKLIVGGATYTLVSRGYWMGKHYYCKVLRTTNQMTGVWLHNDGNNAGYAQLVNQVPSAIAGAHEETSWLMYSRVWTADKESHIEEAIEKIQRGSSHSSLGFTICYIEVKFECVA